MRLVCTHCGDHYGELKPFEDERTSHGICQACRDFFEQRSGQRLGELVNHLELPAMIMDGPTRVQAASRDLLERAGLRLERPGSLLAGDILGCVHARQPGGCGQASRCAACAIRSTVLSTLRDGIRREQPASVTQAAGPVALRLTAERLPGPLVRLTFEPVLSEAS
ncbi:MAG TPA: hypothetical protein PK668_23005 [Myxococcota bacterium]|nr:hypothetical protein [Myxococcota bacterium]HRY95565.1 hypothetical protein [Myxococcota bacterium]HSA22319.1 hypothetical protein [Myxococcota bacterium]